MGAECGDGRFERSVRLAPHRRCRLCRQSWVVARGAGTRWACVCLRPLERGGFLAAERSRGFS